MFIVALFTIATTNDTEAAQVSVSRGVDETTMEPLHNGILLSCNNENFTLCDSMDGPGEHYAK